MQNKTVALGVGGDVSVSTEINTPSFSDAVEQGKVIEQTGYHQPGGNRHMMNCGCSLTTSKGAYRDVTVVMEDGRTVHFYHQSPIAVEGVSGAYRFSHCGWDTSTTKQRLNRYLPSGYRVYQEDHDWYLSTPDGEVEWNNPMYLNPV